MRLGVVLVAMSIAVAGVATPVKAEQLSLFQWLTGSAVKGPSLEQVAKTESAKRSASVPTAREPNILAPVPVSSIFSRPYRVVGL